MSKVVRISARRMGGRYFVDIRRFDNGHPTKRGVAIPQDAVQETIRQIEEAWRGNESRRVQRAQPRAS